MNSTTNQFVASRRMGLYEPIHPITMLEDFKGNACSNASASTILQVETNLDNQSEDTSHGNLRPHNKYGQEASKPVDKKERPMQVINCCKLLRIIFSHIHKVLRRLAQNREAARKSRLRKKAYVQQLENSKLRLVQLEQELERATQQSMYVGGGLDISQLTCSGTLNSGNAAFGVEYGRWVEEQNRQVNDLRSALHSHISEGELRLLVDGGMNHYFDLFRMKEAAAKADVIYLMSGMWITSVERLFLWIGGFRPSELLKGLTPQVEPFTEEQVLHIWNLTQACQQAEDALTQGMDKLNQFLAHSVGASQLGEGNYLAQMEAAIENLEALERFVKQADHLRQSTLQQMSGILNIRQAARGLLVLGEYFERLQTLSSLWADRHNEPA